MRKHYTECLGYFFNNEELEKIGELAIGRKNALEIGSFVGKSSLAIAMNAEKLLCIDPFDSDDQNIDGDGNFSRNSTNSTLECFLENIEEYNNIRYIKGLSEKIVPNLTETFDYIFIDGDHSFNAVLLDILLCWSILEKNGVLVLHDYANSNVPDSYKYNLGIRRAFHTIFDTYDGIEGTVIWKIKKGEV